MRKNLTTLLAAALVIALALGACGAKSAAGDGYFGASGLDKSPGGEAMDPGMSGDPGGWDADYSDGKYSDVYDSLAGTEKPADMSEKMIYTADVTVETTDFEASVKAVEDMVKFYGAFFESTNVSDLSYADRYYGNSVYRRAYYVIRVPVARFGDMTESMSDVGNVTNSSSRAQNITASFYDTQARRDAYGIEQKRLLAMLERCETVGEMIEIESRLSEVRYQIESLESTLRSWQNEVDYSTVNLTVQEVEEYTKREEPHRSYWQQIGDGFMDSIEAVGDFLKALFRYTVIALPVLVPAAAVVAVIIALIVRSVRRRRKALRKAPDAQIEEGK